MFEKLSITDVDSAGQGGEYTVQVCFSLPFFLKKKLLVKFLFLCKQVGFGWTNGALLWVASNYGPVLATPKCPNLLTVPVATGNTNANTNSSNAALVNQPIFSSIGLFVIVVAGFLILQLQRFIFIFITTCFFILYYYIPEVVRFFFVISLFLKKRLGSYQLIGTLRFIFEKLFL